MATKAKDFVAAGMGAVTPYLYVEDSGRALAYYVTLFGAIVRFKMDGPNDKVLHAELMVNDAIFMLGEANPDRQMKSPGMIGGSPSGIFVYVPDMDATLKAALSAGATLISPAEDMFWGDRTACIVDPFGHNWTIATHIEDVTPDEMDQRQADWMAKNFPKN